MCTHPTLWRAASFIDSAAGLPAGCENSRHIVTEPTLLARTAAGQSIRTRREMLCTACGFKSLVMCSLVASLLAPNESGFFVSGSGQPEQCVPAPQSPKIGDRSLCTYDRNVDTDVGRIPPQIPTVKCRCRDGLCTAQEDFRCQEVTEMLQVAYRDGNTFRNETLSVTLACLCASSPSIQASSGHGRPGGGGNDDDAFHAGLESSKK